MHDTTDCKQASVLRDINTSAGINPWCINKDGSLCKAIGTPYACEDCLRKANCIDELASDAPPKEIRAKYLRGIKGR